jgi:hypothetical protein
MSIIRDVRERVLTKLHELHLQAPGNEEWCPRRSSLSVSRITNVLDAIPQTYQAEARTFLCARP